MSVKFVQVPAAQTTVLDGEWIIMHEENLTITRLNETGGLCWKLLEQPQSIDQLAAAMTEEYEVGQDISRQDAVNYISILIQNGLIEHAV